MFKINVFIIFIIIGNKIKLFININIQHKIFNLTY